MNDINSMEEELLAAMQDTADEEREADWQEVYGDNSSEDD